MKTYEIIWKFSDVIQIIEAYDLKNAAEIADDMLYNYNTPHKDTTCYDIEIEEVENA